MTGPGLVLVGGGGRATALDRLAAVSRWVDAAITTRLEASQRARAAELARERRLRQRRRQRAASRRASLAAWRARWSR